MLKVTFILLLLLFTTTTKAQEKRPYEFEPSGEVANSIINDVVNQSKSTDKPIILIARLGAGETLRKWNLRRLHNVATRLWGVKEIIKAEGESIIGKGCVEIYFEGRLLYRLLAHRNKDLAVDCCELFTDLYPWYKPAKNKKHSPQTLEEKLTETSPNVAYAVPDGSEYTGALLAQLNDQLKSSTKPLILISRLGKDEIVNSLHQRRLKTVTQGLFSEAKGGLVLTKGEKVKGLQQI